MSIADNTIVNDLASNNAAVVLNRTSLALPFDSNQIWGLSAHQLSSGPLDESGTVLLSDHPSLDTSSLSFITGGGSSSPPPSSSAASAALAVTFDTVAPAAPSTPDLLAGSDSGISNSDDITNIALPTFTGTGEDGATVALLDGTTPIGTGTVTAGVWSITATTPLTPGANAIIATQTDLAGNVSAASAALAVTLDSVVPAAPSMPDLVDASDTGASNSDNITDVALPTFTGTGEDGATVALLDGTTPIGTGTVTAGVWSITATTPLTPGANAITATQTDPAGNVSPASAALNVTLGLTPVPTVPAVTAAPSDAVLGRAGGPDADLERPGDSQYHRRNPDADAEQRRNGHLRVWFRHRLACV